MKMIIDLPDDRCTPEMLTDWIKEAQNSIGLKLMVGSIDPQMDRSLIVVIGLLAKSTITRAHLG